MGDHLVSAFLYGASAMAIATAGLIWVRQWLRFRRGEGDRPEELSPVGRQTLGYVAALALGGLAVVLVGKLQVPWEELLFACFAMGLALRCMQYIVRWRSPRVTTAVLTAAVGMGAVIAAAV